MYSKPAVDKTAPLFRGNPYYANRICSLPMAHTTIFNKIKWKLSNCASPKCSCGDEDNAYHSFFAAKFLPSVQINLAPLTSSTIPTAKFGKNSSIPAKNSKNLTRDNSTSTNCCSPHLKTKPKFTAKRNLHNLLFIYLIQEAFLKSNIVFLWKKASN